LLAVDDLSARALGLPANSPSPGRRRARKGAAEFYCVFPDTPRHRALVAASPGSLRAMIDVELARNGRTIPSIEDGRSFGFAQGLHSAMRELPFLALEFREG
jgi:hypothetical protein